MHSNCGTRNRSSGGSSSVCSSSQLWGLVGFFNIITTRDPVAVAALGAWHRLFQEVKSRFRTWKFCSLKYLPRRESSLMLEWRHTHHRNPLFYLGRRGGGGRGLAAPSQTRDRPSGFYHLQPGSQLGLAWSQRLDRFNSRAGCGLG